MVSYLKSRIVTDDSFMNKMFFQRTGLKIVSCVARNRESPNSARVKSWFQEIRESAFANICEKLGKKLVTAQRIRAWARDVWGWDLQQQFYKKLYKP